MFLYEEIIDNTDSDLESLLYSDQHIPNKCPKRQNTTKANLIPNHFVNEPLMKESDQSVPMLEPTLPDISKLFCKEAVEKLLP